MMRVDILDNEIFGSFIPSELERYLAATHWRQIRYEENVVSIWEYETPENKYRVWLPLDPGLADYATAVGRLIRTVALAERRSQLQIIEDLDTVVVGDVIRASMWDELNRTSSSIPFSDGLLLLKRSYDMTRAAAWATIEKRPVFPYRSPARVINYMKKLRLGQSERGSYLIKIVSPIEPQTTQPPKPLPGFPPQEEQVPFERQVVINLIKSLDALQMVASETQQRGRFYFKPFEEVVDEGVSANLCEAVVGEDRNATHYRPIEVSVSWSYVLISPTSVPIRTVSFTKDLMPHIAQAARVFRERNPEEISLRGFVTALSRSQKDEPGVVRVVGYIEGRMRSVRITLVGEAYNTAIHAHENDLQVACEGELTKQGKFYVLRNPVNFRIVDQDELGEQLSLFGG